MGFNAEQIKEETNVSMNAMLMLNSSCQGLIQSNIEQVDSEWYTILSGELKNAEELVIDWRNNGFLYFKSSILNVMNTTGNNFLNAETKIDAIYAKLTANYSDALKGQLIQQLQELSNPISNLVTQMNTYVSKLTTFGSKMQVVHNNMEKTINKIQSQEAAIQDEINEINDKIANLNKQIKTDREAITKAKKARKKGIIETIFGVIFAPFTFGASLILAGIGVASIAEAQDKINDMQGTISKYQKSIVGDQQNLSKDQKEISTLKTVLMGTEMTLNDMDYISQSLQVLKVSWAALGEELSQIITKTQNAENSTEVIVGKAWFNSACLEWSTIIAHAENLDNRTISTSRVSIG